jgi:hypothetical protein
MDTELRTGQPKDWWNTLALGVPVVLVLLTIELSACSYASPSVANANKAAAATSNARAFDSAAQTTGEGVPIALADAGEYGEDVYDYAKANDWKNAEDKLAALTVAVNQVPDYVENQSTAEVRLDGNVVALGRAVTAKDRQASMHEANQVIFDVAYMTTAYKPSVPVEVARLAYYARELEIWAEAEDTKRLQATAREMRRQWGALRPSVAAHNAAEAKKFDALVAQVEGAKTPAEYGRLAKPVLDEVDNLEKVFHR